MGIGLKGRAKVEKGRGSCHPRNAGGFKGAGLCKWRAGVGTADLTRLTDDGVSAGSRSLLPSNQLPLICSGTGSQKIRLVGATCAVTTDGVWMAG